MSRDPETDRLLDTEFERALLSSARGDVVPSAEATREAWSRFASSASGAALGAGVAVGLAEMTRSLRLASLRWFTIGALGGSALTAGWFVVRPALVPVAASAPSALRNDDYRAPAVASVASVASAAPSASPTGSMSRAASVLAQRSAAPHRARSPEPPGSTLAAEVAALDRARAAHAAGAHDRALVLLDDYRRRFPDGQLARDAAAVAIEALHARGELVEASRQAAEYSRRYPGDPHAARLRALARE